MANQQLYTVMNVTIQGSLMAETGSASLSRNSGSSPVFTLLKGYAGESPGAPNVEIDIDGALPAAGWEFDAGRYVSELLQAEVGLLAGNKTAIFKGYIIKDSLKQGVNQAASYSMSFRGGFSHFE